MKTPPNTLSGILFPTTIFLLFAIGSVLYFFLHLGLAGFFKAILWPSLLFTVFALIFAVRPIWNRWNSIVWRMIQIWSGLWTFLFIGFFPLVCLSAPIVGMALMGAWFNPFLAIGAHAVMFGCATEILKTRNADSGSHH